MADPSPSAASASITSPARPSTWKSSSKAGASAGKSTKFELTEEQKQEISEAFDLFDTDGSREICVPPLPHPPAPSRDAPPPPPSLTCPVCGEDYDLLDDRVPAELSCGHSFCLKHVIETNSADLSSLPLQGLCPTCGVPYIPPLSKDEGRTRTVEAFSSIFNSLPPAASGMGSPPPLCSARMISGPATGESSEDEDPQDLKDYAPPHLRVAFMSAAAKKKRRRKKRTKRNSSAQQEMFNARNADADVVELCDECGSLAPCSLCFERGASLSSLSLLPALSSAGRSTKKKVGSKISCCGGCGSPFSERCARDCDSCEHCRLEGTNRSRGGCLKCRSRFCVICAAKCKVCKKTFCHTCVTMTGCRACDLYVCDGCGGAEGYEEDLGEIDQCDECEEYFCSSHLISCDRCDMQICRGQENEKGTNSCRSSIVECSNCSDHTCCSGGRVCPYCSDDDAICSTCETCGHPPCIFKNNFADKDIESICCYSFTDLGGRNRGFDLDVVPAEKSTVGRRVAVVTATRRENVCVGGNHVLAVGDILVAFDGDRGNRQRIDLITETQVKGVLEKQLEFMKKAIYANGEEAVKLWFAKKETKCLVCRGKA